MATRWSCSTLLLVVVLAVLANGSIADESNGDDANAALARKEHVLRTHMSTKTMYPAPTDAELASDAANDAAPAACRPIQLNFVVRHGTRFPTVKDIDRIAATRAKLEARGAWPGRDANANDWQANNRRAYDRARGGWLAPAGVFEQISLGERLRARFGRSLRAHYAREAFVFEHTYKPRTQQSAMGFAFGFFGGTQPVHYTYDPMGQDHELRFFDNCPAFDRQIETNKSATAHHSAYRSSRQMARNLRAFQRRAGDATLTQKHLEAAYAGCAFDVAVHGEFSEWCALLDEPTLLSMDYFQDLKHFYKKSHGHAIAFEIAAPLLQDMHESMRARVEGRSRVEGHFRFAHAETILPLGSLLNLSYFDRHVSDRDGHFLADTPLEVVTRRPFRGSVLAPFSANIGFVLYECDSPNGSSDESTFRVQTLLHERTVRFPDCGGQALCPFETFEKMFSQWIHEYDFFAQCAVD